jgi:hypothetical protein
VLFRSTSETVNVNFDNISSDNNIKLENEFDNIDNNIKLEIEVEEKQQTDYDDFLMNLKKQREKELFNNNPPTAISQHYNKPIDIDDNPNLKFTMREDFPLDLKVEIEKTKIELNQNYNNDDINQNDGYGCDDILSSIIKNRTIKYNSTIQPQSQPQPQPQQQQQSQPQTQPNNHKNKLNHIKKQEQQPPQQQPQQPPQQQPHNQYKDSPLWKQLEELLKNQNNDYITKNIVLSFVNLSLNYYPIICSFIFYSDDLNNKKQLKITLVKSMIDIMNNYIKLYNNKQMIWNNKNVYMAINLLQKCNLQKLFDKLSLEIKQKN